MRITRSLAHFKNINSNCVIEKNIAMLSLFQMPSTHTAQAPMLPAINNTARGLSHALSLSLSHSLSICLYCLHCWCACVCVCVCEFVTALMGISMSVIALHVALFCSVLLCPVVLSCFLVCRGHIINFKTSVSHISYAHSAQT